MSSAPIKSRGAVVLSGGESRRMGRDKALLLFGDEAMLQRTVRLLALIVPAEQIVIVAAADQTLPALPPAVQVIRDEVEGLGPLPAIAAGLHALSSKVESSFVTGCDAPLLKPAAVSWLFERLDETQASRDENGADGVVLQDAQRLYPLFAAYRTGCAAALAEAWQSGETSLHDVLRSGRLNMRFMHVDELRGIDPQLESLVNCNTPEEHRRALNLGGFQWSKGNKTSD
jgi:molybdenum cofactor guanylyltransferase